jgi:flagellar biosynthesis protein FlhG
MASLFEDQAAGLRRLFAATRAPTAVAFVGPVGRGAVLLALARALAGAGRQVLLIDERGASDGALAACGLRARFDLLQAVRREVPVGRVLLQPEAAIRLLPAARAVGRYDRLERMERHALAEWLRRLARGADFVLVDAAEYGGEGCSPLLPQPQRIVVTLSPDARAITAAYAGLKRLARCCCVRRFGIVVLGATDAQQAATVLANLREVAQRHLGCEIEPLGGIAEGAEAEGLGAALAAALLERRRQSAADPAALAAPGPRRTAAGVV